MTPAERLSDLYGVSVQQAAAVLALTQGDEALAQAAIAQAVMDGVPERAQDYAALAVQGFMPNLSAGRKADAPG